MTDAFDKIYDICNEARLQRIKGNSEYQVVAISRQFEKEILEALENRELHRANEMMLFVNPRTFFERIPRSLSGYALMGVTISVYDEEK